MTGVSLAHCPDYHRHWSLLNARLHHEPRFTSSPSYFGVGLSGPEQLVTIAEVAAAFPGIIERRP
jgi:hypothetical protein